MEKPFIYPAKLHYDTKTIIMNLDAHGYNKKYFCAYCGKEVEPYTDIVDRYEECKFYHCDCPDAVKEHELQTQIEELNDKIECIKLKFPKPKYKMETMQQVVKIE